jgi:hypothetical protein
LQLERRAEFRFEDVLHGRVASGLDGRLSLSHQHLGIMGEVHRLVDAFLVHVAAASDRASTATASAAAPRRRGFS